MVAMDAKPTVKLHLTVELETSGDTKVEEFGQLLKMLHFEVAHWPRWRGKLRRIKFDRKGI